MRKTNLIILLFSVAVILLAPLFGDVAASFYLMLSGGMETEKFLLIIDGFIHSFQIVGTLTAAYALFGCKRKED